VSNESGQAKLASLAVTFVAVAGVVLSVVLSSKHGLAGVASGPALGLYTLALVLEWLAVETPYLGYASVAPAVYIALALVSPAASSAVASLVALLVRSLLRGSQEGSRRILDFGYSLLSAVLVIATTAGVKALGLGGRSLEAPIAVVVAAIVLLVADFVYSGLAAVVFEGAALTAWRRVRSAVRPTMVASTLLAGVAPAVASVIERDPLGGSLMAACGIAVPLILLSMALRTRVDKQFARKVDKLDRPASFLSEEQFDYKLQNRALMEDLQKRVDEITILFEMGQQLGASKDLDKTLDIVIKMVRRLLIYQSCVVYLVDEAGNLAPARWVSPYSELIEMSQLLQLEESTVNLVVLSKKSVLIGERKASEENRVFSDEKCLMCIPLIVKDEIIGVIYVGTLRPGTYTEDQVHLLETLANPAAIAIKSAQFHALQELQITREQALRQQANERNLQLDVLYQLGRDLNRSVKISDILDLVTEKMALLVAFQSCIFFVLRPQDSQLVATKVNSPYEGLFTGFTASPEDQETILGWVASNKRTLLLEDTKESRFSNIIANERSLILLPLLADEEVIGELYLGAAEAGFYDQDTLGLVNMVASQAAMAVQKAMLFEKTESLAITDGVTGLYTHRYFQERLSEEIRWSERTGRSVCLIMVDTDHFKKFNDTLGHPEGDRLLREIAALLRSYTRESDLVCRYGGDEFSLILRDTDKDSAVVTAERIREAFQLRFGKNAVKVTSSIGVACVPVDARTKPELVAAADAALYKSKQGGRNRVSMATPLSSQQVQSH
jgi:diguanylate cyclase (GGDEF)-like protein